MYSVSPLTVGYLLHRSSSVYNISPLTVGYLYSVAQVTLSVQHIPSYSGLFVVCCTGHPQCTTYPLLQWVICILLHRSPSVYNISPLTVDYLWSVAQVTVSVQHIPSYSGLFVFCCTGHRQCTTYPLLQWIICGLLHRSPSVYNISPLTVDYLWSVAQVTVSVQHICGLLHRSPSVYNISPLTVGYLYSVAQVTISIQWTPSYITITGSNINILVGGGGVFTAFCSLILHVLWIHFEAIPFRGTLKWKMCGIEGSMFSIEEFDAYLKMLRKEFQNICLERWVVFCGIYFLHRGSTVLAACEIQRQAVNHSLPKIG